MEHSRRANITCELSYLVWSRHVYLVTPTVFARHLHKHTSVTHLYQKTHISWPQNQSSTILVLRRADARFSRPKHDHVTSGQPANDVLPTWIQLFCSIASQPSNVYDDQIKYTEPSNIIRWWNGTFLSNSICWRLHWTYPASYQTLCWWDGTWLTMKHYILMKWNMADSLTCVLYNKTS